MKRNGSLESNFLTIPRSKSIEGRNLKSSVASILKDPSKSNLKHNKSVHFQDSFYESSEESFEIINQQQNFARYKNTISKKIPFAKPQSFLLDEKFKSFGAFNAKKTKNSKEKSANQEEIVKRNKVIKVNSKRSAYNSSDSSTSPKAFHKVMNFQFRDQRFYEKLNKFISYKDPESRGCRKSSFNQDIPDEKGNSFQRTSSKSPKPFEKGKHKSSYSTNSNDLSKKQENFQHKPIEIQNKQLNVRYHKNHSNFLLN